MANKLAEGSPDLKTGENGEADDAPEYITKAEFNSAFNGFDKAQKKEMKKFLEEFKGLIAAKAQETEELEKEKNAPNPELLKMQKQLEATSKQLEAIKAEKEAEVSKRKDTELTTTLQAELTKAGVPTSKVKAVMAMMKHEDKVVGYDEDGNMVFKDSNGDTDLATGVKNWSKTDEGKEFIAATGVKGAGNKSPAGKYGTTHTPLYSENEVWAAIAQGKDPSELK